MVDDVLQLARDERHVQRLDLMLGRLLLAEGPSHHHAAVEIEHLRQTDEA